MIVKILSNKAKLLVETGRYEEALGDYEMCISLEPKNLMFYKYQAETIELMEKKSNAAAKFKKINDELDYYLNVQPTYPTIEKFNNFEKFLQDGGANINSL